MKKLTVLIILLGMFNESSLRAQIEHYWDRPDDMLQKQSALLFNEAYKVLDEFPPTTDPEPARKLALFSLDALQHDTRLDGGDAFYDYTKMVGERVLRMLKDSPEEGETRIIKVYSHSFIVQTREVTVAFDLVRGGSKHRPFIPDDIMRSIVNQCDILFVSHIHGDHADRTVAQMFDAQGKYVITPFDDWADLSSFVRQVREDDDTVKEKIEIPSKGISLVFRAFPGHQGPVPNNVYAVTLPNGKTVMHTGDQANSDDMQWISRVKKKVKVDALMINCWASSMNEFVNGVNPSVVVSGHENEMGHTIDHREPYWLSFINLEGISKPYVIMAWGEMFDDIF